LKGFLRVSVMILAFSFALGTFATRSQAQDYVVTNDDNPALNTATVFRTTSDPYVMTQVSGSPFSTRSHGLGVYLPGSVNNSISAQNCVFISDAMGLSNNGVSDIAAFSATSQFALTLRGNFVAVNHDSGSRLGVGLALNGKLLYSSYTTTGTIAVWKVNLNCTLQYMTETHSVGLNGGATDGMAVTPDGTKLIATYADGSVAAFAVGTGEISALNEILVAGYPDGGFPNGVFIDSTGKWAIFADKNEMGGPTEIDVAPITSTGLGASTVYGGPSKSLDLGTNNLGSANLNLSPDNSVLYVNGVASGSVQPLSFNETTGAVTTIKACSSFGTVFMTGFGTLWSSPGVIATLSAKGKGTGIYVALAGLTGSSSSYVDILTVNKQGCLQEQPSAPGPPAGQDPNGGKMFSMSGVPRKNPFGEQ
jgi:hypothetical protein